MPNVPHLHQGWQGWLHQALPSLPDWNPLQSEGDGLWLVEQRQLLQHWRLLQEEWRKGQVSALTQYNYTVQYNIQYRYTTHPWSNKIYSRESHAYIFRGFSGSDVPGNRRHSFTNISRGSRANIYKGVYLWPFLILRQGRQGGQASTELFTTKVCQSSKSPE